MSVGFKHLAELGWTILLLSPVISRSSMIPECPETMPMSKIASDGTPVGRGDKIARCWTIGENSCYCFTSLDYYLASSKSLYNSWTASGTSCQYSDMTLVAIETEAESTLLTEHIMSHSDILPDLYWTTGKYDSNISQFTWRYWINGVPNGPLTYTNWAEGSPDGSNSDFDCILLNCSKNEAGGPESARCKWHDMACGEGFGFICEAEIGNPNESTQSGGSTAAGNTDSGGSGVTTDPNGVVTKPGDGSLQTTPKGNGAVNQLFAPLLSILITVCLITLFS